MRYRAQIFGGRGGGSGRGGGGWSDSEVGATPAKFMYNGAKRKTGGEDGYVKNSKYENGLHDIDGGKTTAEQLLYIDRWNPMSIIEPQLRDIT